MMHDLRCNLCDEVFKVSLPEEIEEESGANQRFTYKAQAALSVHHFGMGMPMNRLDHIQSLGGERLPVSTQFDQLELVANTLQFITNAARNEAANGYLIQGDDIACKVLELMPELRERRTDGAITYREGIHTSILISTTNEGELIPILSTGIIHFGELLDEILLKRDDKLPSPFLVCDGSKVNDSTVYPNLIIGGCWQHLKDYFEKASKCFPDQSKKIINLIKDIFTADRETHNMGANQRLEYLQKNAIPIIDEISIIIDEYLEAKVALPKSELGIAMTYFKNQYSKLMASFQYSAIPIHNNISEWSTYLIVRLMNNSMFYKNRVGAAIGDTIMSVILMCYFAAINPIDYIYFCLKNKKKIKENSHRYLPFRVRDEVAKMPIHIKMNFWAPPL